MLVPLSKKVIFHGVLERGNRVQIPKPIRWQFKLEPNQILKVGVNALDLGRGWQFFYGKMEKDGRIHISKVVLLVLRGEAPSLAGVIMEITLEPA